MSPDVRGPRGIAIFAVAFAVLWTVSVVVVWQQGWLPEAMRPWFRALFWMAAAVLWLVWLRLAEPMRWIGVGPLSRQALLLTVAAFAGVLAWNLVRVEWLMAPAGRLGTFSLAAYVWGFMGVLEEELVFRGVLQTDLQSRMHWTIAVALAGIAFLAIHVPGWLILSMHVNAFTAASVLLIGLVCGALRYWSGSLWPAVAAHWANNLGAQL
jgi:membrane protease YdiL (CAAX protease family)